MSTPSPSNNRRTILTGVILISVCLIFVFAPLVVGVNAISKSIVAFALIGLCLGGSIVLHGAFDWWRAR